ncbi:DNA polymerase I [Methylomagnum sp.]
MSDPTPKHLVLVDGSSFLYRAFHALPPLSNSKGQPTGAVLGVANMLRKLVAAHATRHVGVVFDAPGRTFRDDLFEQYKAHRPPMPDDLRAQIKPLHDIIRALGLPLLIETGVEADDVIGTLAVRAAEQGYTVVISTGDKDMAQLVNGHITLENTMYDTRLDRAGVIEKFGVPPECIIDYLTLVGDTSDNIPGVPKVGPKTAAKWLQEYGSLDAIIASADKITGKVGENLRAALDQIPLSRQLATIRCDLELPLTPDQLQCSEPDNATLRELLARMEFNAWLRQLDASDPTPAAAATQAEPAPTANYQAVLTTEDLDHWLAKLAAADLFAFDTETTSLDYTRAEVVGVSFAVEPGEAAYVPVAHDYPGAPAQLSREYVLDKLRPLLEDPHRPKLGQNLKYDANVLANHGLTLRGIVHDTMLQSYVLDSTGRHDMDSLAENHLGHKTIHYEDVAGKGAKQIPFSQVGIEEATAYAAEDADITLRLHRHFWPKLEAEPGLRQLYETLEIPLVPVLSRIERTGVLVDVFKLAEQSRELEQRMAEIEKEAHAAAGNPFNLGSPKQIQTILYDKLQLPVVKKTPTGQPSTDESVLAELADQGYELPRLILDYRSVAKLKSTYTDKLPGQINPRTNRVHTSYHQAVAATGRLSSSDPNLQNIPVRTAEGRRIRQAFIAPEGSRILAADYSQIELRIMAHFSGDANLRAAFAENADVHRHTAAEVFGVALDEVTTDQRRSAKAINFGLIYGMSAFGLAKQLGIERNVAQRYIDTYFARYPGVKAFMDQSRETAKDKGYVETLGGRRLYVPEITSRNAQRRQYAERTAINAPMQGTAADIIKRAMIAVDGWIQGAGGPVKMIMQVHDELVFEVADDFVETAAGEIRGLMCNAAELAVPLLVDVGVGGNWDEAH